MKNITNYIFALCILFALNALAQNKEDNIKLILPHSYFVKPNNSFIGEKYSLSYRKNNLNNYIVYSVFDNQNADFIYSDIIYQKDEDEYLELKLNGGTLSDTALEHFFSEYKEPNEWEETENKIFSDRNIIIYKGKNKGEIVLQNSNDTNDLALINNPEIYSTLFENDYNGRVSVSATRDRMVLYVKKRILVYDLITGTLLWKSHKVPSKNNNDYLLSGKNIIVTSLPVKKQKYKHIIWYDYINDSILFNTQKYILTTIVKIYQGYNHLAMQYGGVESKKPVSASYINLSTGKFSEIQYFKTDRKFNLGWYIADSLVKPVLSDFDYNRYFENYTQYLSWFQYYYLYYDNYYEPETGALVHVKKLITPMTVNPDFFKENGFGNLDSVNSNYEIVSCFDNKVTYFDRSRDVRIYNIYAHNKEVLFWNGNQTNPQNRKVKLIISAHGVPVFFTEDNYYFSSKQAKNFIAFFYKGKRYTFEQFDLKYNRPDIVLARLGYAPQELIDAYHQAYQKRLKKMGFTEEQLSGEFHIPETHIENFEYMPVIEQNDIELNLNFKDSKYKLELYNIWLNDVPLFGMRGKSLGHLKTDNYKTKEHILLSEGRNRIQVSCLNEKGAESFKETVEITYMPQKPSQAKLYFIGIGVDNYAQQGHDLKYSVKDIRDLSAKLKEKYGNNISIDTLFDEQVTAPNVLSLKEKLLKSDINDKIIISFSGHGLLSRSYDYYLATHLIDFQNPESGGLPYEDLEWLLDSIPARRKLLLIDACHSGEVDKDELLAMQNTNISEELKGVKLMYEYKPTLGMKNSFELMQELFSNLNRGTGATIISAAAGNQFAYEKGQLKNGVFTYSILELMNSQKEITVSTLKTAVGKRVEELTNGMQKPSSRTENLENDWRVW